MSSSELKLADLDVSEEKENDDIWERTRVQSIRDVREAEVESKRFELHRIQQEIDTSLITKDAQLQKQVRGITEECGKLRLEVEWLERDLSQVKESARRQILETSTVIQMNKLKLEDLVHEQAKKIQMLQREIQHQRDQFAEAMLQTKAEVTVIDDDTSNLIEQLDREIDATRHEIYKLDRKYDEEALEAKQTAELLKTEIRNVVGRSSELDRILEQQELETAKLQKRLENAEESSAALKDKIRKLTDKRKEMRTSMSSYDATGWASRLQQLINDNQNIL